MENSERILELIRSSYSDEINITPCTFCTHHGEGFEIVISKKEDYYEIIPANLSFSALLFDLVINQHKLLESSDTYRIFVRCECFTVCDPEGNCHKECYLCHTAPDARCYGPFPYCPSNRTLFPQNIVTDDSLNFISFSRRNRPQSVCLEDGFARNSHPTKTIQVIYEKITGGVSSQWVAYPAPRNEEWLGCASRVTYRFVSSSYV